MTCTQQQAETRLADDIAWAGSEVNRLVTIPLTEDRFDACVDFTFNCGCGNFDHSTLLKLINADDMEHSASQFELCDKCGGKVVVWLRL
jgi:lysozyme